MANSYDRYKASSFQAYNEKLPERYDRSIIVRLLRLSRLDDFVLEMLGPDIASLSILDVGCATGRLLERLAEAGARKLSGSDLAPRILEVARRKFTRFGIEPDLRDADAETLLPWPDDTFDAVVTTGVVHHFYHPEYAFDEIGRVLRPDGALFIADACFFPPVREVFNLFLRIRPHAGDYHFYTGNQLRELLLACGWRVHSHQRLNWWSFGIVARKDR
jgi:ubiquinone/menaquinone biosynthesis C-methylase UbiE